MLNPEPQPKFRVFFVSLVSFVVLCVTFLAMKQSAKSTHASVSRTTNLVTQSTFDAKSDILGQAQDLVDVPIDHVDLSELFPTNSRGDSVVQTGPYGIRKGNSANITTYLSIGGGGIGANVRTSSSLDNTAKLFFVQPEKYFAAYGLKSAQFGNFLKVNSNGDLTTSELLGGEEQFAVFSLRFGEKPTSYRDIKTVYLIYGVSSRRFLSFPNSTTVGTTTFPMDGSGLLAIQKASVV